MRNCTLQSVFAPTKRLLLFIALCFTAQFLNAQNLLMSNGNNPGFEGVNGFSTNGYTDISPGVSGSSSNGNYAITGNSGPMNTTSFSNVSPHSGSKMMVIDANNDIFWKQAPNIPLQGGVTYTFSYWVININKNGTNNSAFPNPVIQFTAADQCSCTAVLKSGSAVVNNASWQQVIYEFTPSGSGTKYVRIELSTPSASPNGNDFAIDDLSLTEPPLPLSISTSQTAISCPGLTDGSISVYGFGGIQPYSYTLTPSVGLPVTNATGIFTNLASGNYKVEVVDSSFPKVPVFKNVGISPVLDMTIAASIPANTSLVAATSAQPVNTTICSGIPITISANNMVGYTWTATPVDPSLTSPNASLITVSPTVTTVYKVTATGPTGALSNLIYNGDFENDVAGFSSDYKYLASNLAYEKRTYGVIDNPNSWGSVYDFAQDHTNPGTGKFFITDGSTSTPILDKVWGQNIAVKAGSTYDFEYFLRTITSTSPGLPAKLQLKINGVVVNNTALSPVDVAPPTTAGGWISFKHTWTAGTGVTIATIELYDTETSGAGNDFGLDDLTFKPQGLPSCVVSKEITVNVSTGTSETKFTYPGSVCQSATSISPIITNPGTFTTGGTWSYVSSAGGTLSINSSTGEINPSLSTAGTFKVQYEVLANSAICQAAGKFTSDMTINAVPTIDKTPGGNLCGSGVVNMSATASTGATINWYTAKTGGTAFATGDTANTPVSISSSTDYYVDATLNGCTSAPRILVSGTIKPIPVILTSPGGSSCGPGIVNMSATATAGATINWYTATTGSSFGTGNSINTPVSISSNTTYYVDATLNGCTSDSRTPIVATVDPPLTFSCGAQTNSSVTFNWTVVSGATSYDYEYIKSSDPTTKITGNTPDAFLEVTGLSPLESVLIKVKPIGSVCSVFVGPFSCVASSCNAPLTNQVNDIKICSKGDVLTQVFSSPLGASATFTWTNDNPAVGLATSGAGDLPSFTAANVATKQIAKLRVNAYDPSTHCTGPDMVFTITVNPLPTVEVNNPKACVGSNANVVAKPGITGTYTYFWTVPSDATSQGNVANFSTAVPGSYSVNITDITTSCVSQSASGNVTINAVPTVSVTTNSPVCFGSSATVTAVPDMTGSYNYTWTVPSGAIAPGNVANFSTNVAGNYGVVIADANCTSTTVVNKVIINPALSASITGTTSICYGTGTEISFSGTPNSTVAYTINGNAYQVVLDATGKALKPTGNLSITTDYNLVSVSLGTCSQVQNGIATITIMPLPTVGILGTASICSGTETSIAFTGTPNATATYTVNNGTNQTITLDSLGNASLLTGNLTADTVYNLVSVNSGTCSQGQAGNAVVTISPMPIADFTGVTDICSGDGTLLELSSTTPGTTFTWNAVQTNATGASAGSGAQIKQTLTVTGANPGQVKYIVTPSLGSCKGAQKEITVNVSPIPNVVENTAKKILCSGEEVSIDLSSAIVKTTFSWTVNSVGVTGATAGSGNRIKQLLSTTGFVPGNVVYTITPSVNGCVGLPVKVTIIVNPMPEVFGITPGIICSGEEAVIELSPSIAGTVFDWSVAQHGVIDATDGTGSLIKQVVQTSRASQGSVVYTVTPSLGGCKGVPLDFTVLVNPLPKPILKDGIICVEQGTGTAYKTYTLDSGLSESDYNFQWYLNSLPISGASGNFEAVQSGDYTVQAKNNETGCAAISNIGKVTATVPGLTVATTQTAAFSDNAKAEVTVSGGNAVFEYQLDGGVFQSSNVFEHLTPGPHTIIIGDTNGCTDLNKDFFVIGYPKYFSPNGDGQNDTWNVMGLEGQPAANIFIFDRYGKLLKEIYPSGEGWDGNYTGQPLPATDYWFTVEFTEESEKKIFKAHFSLIR